MGIPADTFYKVYAYSENLGEKRISGGEVEPDLEMAVVLHKTIPWVSRYPTYEVIGCHVKAGFEVPMEMR